MSDRDMIELPIDQAATRLGATVEAVRRRVQRGKTLRGYQRDGQWYVLLPAETMAGASAGRRDAAGRDPATTSLAPADAASLLRTLRETVATLREQVAVKDEQLGQANAIIDRLIERAADPAPPHNGHALAAGGTIDDEALLLAGLDDLNHDFGSLTAARPAPITGVYDLSSSGLISSGRAGDADLTNLRQDMQTLLDRQFAGEKALRAELVALRDQVAQLRLDLRNEPAAPPINLTRVPGAGSTDGAGAARRPWWRRLLNR